MNSNTQSSQRKSQRKEIYRSQRFQPVGLPLPNIELQFGVNSERNISNRGNSQAESSRTISKRRGPAQLNQSLLAIHREREHRDLTQEEHILSQNRVTSTTSLPTSQDSSSLENFPLHLHSYPSHLQSSSHPNQNDNSHQNTISPDEIHLQSDSTSFLNSSFISNYSHINNLNQRNSWKCLNLTSTQTSDLRPNVDDPLVLSLIADIKLPNTNAQKLANNLIKLARHLKPPNLTELSCLNCCNIPLLPVTGQCGHTRCMRCIESNGACPCGVSAPEKLFVNTIIQEIVEKMIKPVKKIRRTDPAPLLATSEQKTVASLAGKSHTRRYSLQRRTSREYRNIVRPRLPMSIQASSRKARELLSAGKFVEAVPHLVRVAASTGPLAVVTRLLLIKTLNATCGVRQLRDTSRELSRLVREQAVCSWVSPADLECVLCTSTFTDPVSTPCGHTYCRSCIERSLYYKKKCALCIGPLENFRLADTRNTIFINSIMASMDMLPLPEETDIIPVVTCCIAFPGMPCPLLIFDPRYWLMVRRVLESGSRRFGMLAFEKGHTFPDYGTVLEICDCVVLEDSRCIVSTVGVSRFRVLERDVRDGCDVARIQTLIDDISTQDEVDSLNSLAFLTLLKAVIWLNKIGDVVRDKIETAFGTFPFYEMPDQWWTTPDGPNWLWWLIAVLPLKSEIKALIISTRSLLKRMAAVSHTFNLMNSQSFVPCNQ